MTTAVDAPTIPDLDEDEEENLFDSQEALGPDRVYFQGQATFFASKRAIRKATLRMDPGCLKSSGTNWFKLDIPHFASGRGDRAVCIVDFDSEINYNENSELSALEHSLPRKFYNLMKTPARPGHRSTDGIAIWGLEIHVDRMEIRAKKP